MREIEDIEVAAPIKRGAMNSEHLRPAQVIYDEASGTVRCPAGEALRRSGAHTRNCAISYRTSACGGCTLKARSARLKQRLSNARMFRPPPSISMQLSPMLLMSLP